MYRFRHVRDDNVPTHVKREISLRPLPKYLKYNDFGCIHHSDPRAKSVWCFEHLEMLSCQPYKQKRLQ